jgi:hypothetical protein
MIRNAPELGTTWAQTRWACDYGRRIRTRRPPAASQTPQAKAGIVRKKCWKLRVLDDAGFCRTHVRPAGYR